MSAEEVDEYLRGIDERKRGTLQRLRESILRAIPEAEEGISYGLPALRVNGRVVAGFAAFKNHLSYLPHSGSVLSQLGDDLVGYTMTKGSLHFPIDEPLPDELVEKLLSVRLAVELQRPPKRNSTVNRTDDPNVSPRRSTPAPIDVLARPEVTEGSQ